MGARRDEGASIAWSDISEGERNVDIATEEVVVVIDETGTVSFIMFSRMKGLVVAFLNDCDKVHPDMQSVVVHIPFHILDPAGVIDEFFETRSALHDVVDS